MVEAVEKGGKGDTKIYKALFKRTIDSVWLYGLRGDEGALDLIEEILLFSMFFSWFINASFSTMRGSEIHDYVK